jgi:hypothetical protein
VATSVTSGASAQSNIGGQAAQFLPTEGGSMIGPIAFYPSLVTINASDEIDISLDSSGGTPKASTYVIVSFSSPDTLQLINGAAFTGQLLYLQIPANSTLTIEDFSSNATGNIVTTDGNDLVVTTPSTANPNIITLMFDPTQSPNSKQGGWVVVSSGTGSGTSTSGVTDHLFAMYTSNTASANPLPMPTSVVSSSGSTITINNPTTNRVRLTGGNTYKMIAYIAILDDEDSMQYEWFDETASAVVGKRGFTRGVDHTPIEGFEQAVAVVSPATTRDYRLDELTPLGSPTINMTYSAVYVERLSSGGVSFPIRPTITEIASPTSTQDLDLNTTGGHVFDIIADKDFTITFSNPPAAGIQHTFEIELTNDSTSTARVVTLPGTVRQLSSITVPATTPVSRGVYTLRTNDGGLNYDIIQVVAGTTGNSGATPWTQDIDADGFDLQDLSNLEFRISTGTPAASTPSIYLDASGDMVENVAAGDQFFRTVNGTVIEQFQDAEWEIRTETQDGPVIKLNNNDQTPTDNDTVGTINFTGNDDLLANVTYAAIRTLMDDVTSTSKQADFDIRVMHDNALSPIVDYTGLDATMRISSAVDVFRPNRDDGIAFGSASQSWADSYFANFMEIKEMTTPANPPANSGRLYVADDGGTTTLYFRDSAGTETNLLSGSLTPWTSNIDADGFDLQDISNIEFRATTGAPSSATLAWYADADGIIGNVALGDDYNLNINGTTEFTVDATDVNLQGNNLVFNGTTEIQETGGTLIHLSSGTEVFRYNTSSIRTTTKLDLQDNEIILDEMGTAPTGISNAAIIFAEDNGAGKTRLMAQFPTGAAQQIAIEP